MYGITLNTQNLTGNFRGFAMKSQPKWFDLDNQYNVNIDVKSEDFVVLCETHITENDQFMTNVLTPPGIALRGIRENAPVELAANSQNHRAKMAIFSPNYRRKENYGIEVYNDNGGIAYSSADHYLSVVATVALPFGKKAAMAQFNAPPPERIDFPIPKGKRYGVVLGTWGTGSSNLTKPQINRYLSSHPVYRRHNFYYFGYYCTIVYWPTGKSPDGSAGRITFWLGSSGLPIETYSGRADIPTATALIVDMTDV